MDATPSITRRNKSFGAPSWLERWLGLHCVEHVFIDNKRLGAMNICLLLLAAGYVASTVFTHPDTMLVLLTPGFNLWIWSEYPGFKDNSLKDFNSDMCTPGANTKYDYWYDSKGAWSYTNFTCQQMGSTERAQKTYDHDASPTSSPEIIFVPTYVEDTFITSKVMDAYFRRYDECTDTTCKNILGMCPKKNVNDTDTPWRQGTPRQYRPPNASGGRGQCLCECTSTVKYFTTGVGKIQIGMGHFPHYGEDMLEVMGHPPQPKSTKDLEMKTIVRDTNGNEVVSFAPGDSIYLSVDDILMWGGGYSLEDNHHSFSSENGLLKSDYPEEYKSQLKQYPHLRITGAKIYLNVQYYNLRAKPRFATMKNRDELPICYIDIDVKAGWNSMPLTDQISKSFSHTRYQYGVTTYFHVSGRYAFYNHGKIYAFIASAMVYLAVPAMIMGFFTKFFLGSLSALFYPAQMETFEYWSNFSGEVARSIAALWAYRETLDNQNTKMGVDRKSLHWTTVRQQIVDLFEAKDVLDADEMDALLSVLLRILDDGSTGDKAVSQQQWIDHFVNNDITTLKTWANLFDVQRTPCPLERMFDNHRSTRQREAKVMAEGCSRESEKEKHKEEKDARRASRRSLGSKTSSEEAPSLVQSKEAGAIMDMITNIETMHVSGSRLTR